MPETTKCKHYWRVNWSCKTMRDCAKCGQRQIRCDDPRRWENDVDGPSAVRHKTPPMPEGFNDRAAWDAIHFNFSERGSRLDEAVIGWQKDNQERVNAAIEASHA